MSIAAWPTLPCGTSPRPWRGFARAAGWSRSPARAVRPDNPAWRDAFVRLAGTRARRLHRRHRWRGLCQARHHHRDAADRDRQLPADDPTAFPASPGMAPRRRHAARLGHRARSTAAAGRRLPVAVRRSARPAIPRTVRAYCNAPVRLLAAPAATRRRRTRLRDRRLDTAGRRPAHRCAL